ncbi:ArsR/SmtB family transcription factor [Novispirillum sp. DQ9]|uniref:ArsR/SmtB family transcription factor n=1 Tax=Novispirillum sp. DQ9 TaxID=3398612 RepID=UPI003C7B9708
MPATTDPVEFFRALADPTRLRCLALIVAEGDVCVCELTYAIDEIQPKISRHLAALRKAGLVEDRRQGTWVFYRLRPDLAPWARDALFRACDGFADSEPFRSDREALRAMPGRPPRSSVA